jgi:hypothetical protein
MLRNKTTLYEKLGFETDEFSKVLEFSKTTIIHLQPLVLLTYKETLCAHRYIVDAYITPQ